MELISIIIVASIIGSSVSLFFTFYLRRIKRKIQSRNESRKEQVLLDYQREQVENHLYEIIDSQKMDNLILTGNEELFVTTSSDRPKLSNSAIDNSFYQSMGLDVSLIKIEKLSAFVVMPFNTRYKKIYESIKIATRDAGFICRRSDDVFVTGDILRNIVRLILQSQVVIAVVDGNNPNVFYEVGIAHSIGKPVIFVANKNRMPDSFDLDHNRIVLYNNNVELERTLSKFLITLREDE